MQEFFWITILPMIIFVMCKKMRRTAEKSKLAIKERLKDLKKEVRSKAEIDRRQLLAALALDEDEAITAAALSEIKAERPDTIINDSGLPDEQVRAIFGPLGIDF